jgi:ribonuclease HI
LKKTQYLSFALNYDDTMCVSEVAQSDIRWWIQNLNDSCPFQSDTFHVIICTDASLSGWGAFCQSDGRKMHGYWTVEERSHHINYLELTAIENALKVFATELNNVTFLLRVDNTVAISYINRLGGCHLDSLHEIAKRIWKWCEARKLWLLASYIRSKCNVEADFESRREISGSEWFVTHGPLIFPIQKLLMFCPSSQVYLKKVHATVLSIVVGQLYHFYYLQLKDIRSEAILLFVV